MATEVAWRMPEGDVVDQRAENRCVPNEPVSVEDLRDLGLLHWRLDPKTMLTAGEDGLSKVDHICRDMGYKNRDEVMCSPGKLANYEERLHGFFKEHIHEDDEIRLILGGVGYFDVRDKTDRWVRVRMVEGDLIVLPAGIYHRFTMDTTDYTHAMRLFKEVPVWTPINRPCDENEVRRRYLEKYITNPATPQTAAGPVDGALNLYLSHPEHFDKTMRTLIHGRLRGATRDVLVMYFTGIHNPETKQSWCPDCAAADPIVAASVKRARELVGAERNVVLLEMAIERSSYLNNPDYPLRKHPFVELRCIPTVIVAAARPPSESDEPGIDIISRMEDVNGDWVEKISKV
jgi:1,2-dihydroxy-3-keto-5-methylthiopentene dioxygenase